MTAESILRRFLARFPAFAEAWDSPHNYFRNEDGSFTRCGVFSEFSTYFHDHYEQFTPAQVAEVGQFMTDCMASPDAELVDVTASCFLENVAGERFSRDFRRHLSGESLRCYDYWNDPTPGS